MELTITDTEAGIQNANTVKRLVLERLLKDGVINEQQFSDYNTNWQVILIKLGWFDAWCKRFSLEKEKDCYRYKLVNFES